MGESGLASRNEKFCQMALEIDDCRRLAISDLPQPWAMAAEFLYESGPFGAENLTIF
jgi:hypothetical protein